MSMGEDYETVLATLTDDIEPSAGRTIAITACHRLGEAEAEVERLRKGLDQKNLHEAALNNEIARLKARLRRIEEAARAHLHSELSSHQDLAAVLEEEA